MQMHDLEPTLAEAAALLAAASVVDVETDRGESVELWTISSEGQSVAAGAILLAVASVCGSSAGSRPTRARFTSGP